MALAQTTNQILRSAGEGTEVVANSPITGNGTSEQPLGIDENWHGQDGESVTFTVSAIPSGTRVTLSGAQGTESFDVMNGVDGTNGTDGAQGPAGPQGPQGDPGVQGETGPQGIQGERGPAGPQGEQGEQGPAGQDGAPGKSAYEIAVEDGFTGNVQEWLESLKGDPGEDGKNAYELAVEAGFTGTSAEWLDSLVGPQGPEGPSGASGASGFSPTVSTTPITTGTSGTQVTITDLTGSHTFDIMNGAKGDQGPSGESYTGSLMPLIGDNGIAVTSNAGNAVVEISSVAHDATISGNGTVASPLGVVNGLPAGADITPYSAGDNINITNHVVSGKNWTNDITAASSYAYNQATADAQGHTYTGISPIDVNNTLDTISAKTARLSGVDPIALEDTQIGDILYTKIMLTGSVGNFNSSAFGIIPSTQVTALTSLSYYDTGIGKSNQLSGNSTNNLGWTMPSAYANVKNDIITDADARVQSRYSYKLSYTTPATGFTGNSGLEIRKYIGNAGTTRKVLSGNSTLGELVPEDYTSRQYLSTNAAGNMVWDDIANISPIVLVATSGDIPATGVSDNKVYIVTGTGS